MNTKLIARLTGLSVSAVNEAARELRIAFYDYGTRCWRVENRYAAAFLQNLRAA